MRYFIVVAIAVVLYTGSALAQDAQQEEIVLTTYYPAPYGEYNEIQANELKLHPHDMPSPAAGNAGNMYYDSDENQLKVSDGASYIDVGSESGVPAGAVMAFAMSNVPAGWLECNGQQVARADYSNLFSAIGYSYGGSGNLFSVPDYRGYFLRGLGGVDPHAGRTIGSIQDDMYKSHIHGIEGGYWSGHYMDKISNIHTALSGVHYGFTYVAHPGPTGTSGGAETRPKNIAVKYCIKY